MMDSLVIFMPYRYSRFAKKKQINPGISESGMLCGQKYLV